MPEKIEFVTSASLPYYERYGFRLIGSFRKFAPTDALTVYAEDFLLDSEAVCRRVRFRGLMEVPGIREFLRRARPKVEEKLGMKVTSDPDERLANPKWDYRWDAVTFGKKAFAIIDALRTTAAEYLFWIDADVVIRKPLPTEVLTGLFKGADIVYFGRSKPHSECGFVGWRMSDRVKIFTDRYAAFYEEDEIFQLTGWTDCHAFDAALAYARDKAQAITARNLSTKEGGHVIEASPLGAYLDHQKGRRKQEAVK